MKHRFGFSVAIDTSGERVAVGANEADINGTNSGQTKLYGYPPFLKVSSAFSKDFSIYPNPAQNNITITGADNSSLRITDVAGRVMYVAQKISAKTAVNIASYPSGIYFAVIVDKQGSRQVSRFVKE